MFLFLLNFFLISDCLRFQNGKFTLLQLTDLHLGEDDTYDQLTKDGIKKMIQTCKPSVVGITGDIVSDYAYYGSPTFFQDNFGPIIQIFQETNTPYFIGLGNHDVANLRSEQVLEYDKKQKNSLTLQNKFNGINYYVKIMDLLEQKELLRFWVFDASGQGCLDHSASWNCVHPKVVQSYSKEAQDCLYSVILLHIPPQEFENLWNDYKTYGKKYDKVACPIINTNLVKTALNQGKTQLMLVGHNHNNDYGGIYQQEGKQIELIYGRKTGYGGYRLCCGRQMGGRLLTFNLDENDDISYTNQIVTVDGEILSIGSKVYHSYYRDEGCWLTTGAGWGGLQYVGIFMSLYTLMFLLGLSTLCLKVQQKSGQIN